MNFGGHELDPCSKYYILAEKLIKWINNCVIKTERDEKDKKMNQW